MSDTEVIAIQMLLIGFSVGVAVMGQVCMNDTVRILKELQAALNDAKRSEVPDGQ